MRAFLAPAKLNLSLRVFSPEPDGYHPLDSLVAAIDWYDHVRIAPSDEDRLVVDTAAVPDDGDNLVWKAMQLYRSATGVDRPVLVELSKRIPAGAGLGGGSSDAAATVVAAADLFDTESIDPAALFSIGADVPFFMTGGLARMTGRGELIEPVAMAGDYAVAIVVPPVELSTPKVYQRWDSLGEPEGPGLAQRHVPPALRGASPLRNDLWPAALDLAPELGDWRAELADLWGTAVAMTGSGSSLFAFFGDRDEAEDAVMAVTLPARSRRAAVPVSHGARLDPRYTPERP